MSRQRTATTRCVFSQRNGFAGARVLELRRHLGLSQDALARLFGVHTVTVNRWELGKSPMTSWFQLLVASLLHAVPRPGLASLLYEPSTNPVAVLGWLLADANQAARPTLATSGRSPPRPGEALMPVRPPADAMTNPHTTRFNLLEVDDGEEPTGRQ